VSDARAVSGSSSRRETACTEERLTNRILTRLASEFASCSESDSAVSQACTACPEPKGQLSPHAHSVLFSARGCQCCITSRRCNTKQRLGRPVNPLAYIKPLYLPDRVRKPSELRYAYVPSRPFKSLAQPCFRFRPFFLVGLQELSEREDVIDGERRAHSQYPRGYPIIPSSLKTDGTGPDSFPLFPRRTEARVRGSMFGMVTHVLE